MALSLEKAMRRPSWMTPFGQEAFGGVFFDRLWPEWRRIMGDDWTPNVDFVEKDGQLHLTAEVPGLRKEDISVTVAEGYVTISGKKEAEKEEKGTDYYVRETRRGSFSRTFRLPGDVDEKKVEAHYKDGLLTVVMPKKEGEKAKKIEIH